MNPALPIIDRLLEEAIQLSATDLHFYPAERKIDIYLRILGRRQHHRTISTSQFQLILTYFKFSSGMDIGESRKPQDGSITRHFPEFGSFSLRLSTLPFASTESLAIRILPQEELLPAEKLFLFPNQLQILKRWAQHKSGLILITGPTGSGKSTTLYALIRSLTTDYSYQAITLEDPVEKKLRNVIQVQLNSQAGITYQTGLKAALRHDPDVLMIGEIRDEETARFAFQASLTGHLVLTTLHAKNTTGTIYRLLEMGIRKQDLLQSLLAVASMELIPIQRKNRVERAAIMELLDGKELEEVILGKRKHPNLIHSFSHLRRKVYAYGFSPEASSRKEKETARRNPAPVS